MPDRSRRAILREQTSEAHASLDTTIGAFDSLDSYRDYLRGIHAFRIPFETRLARTVWPLALSGWQHQSFGSLIVQDLVDLEIEPLGDIPAPEFGSSRDDLIGILYVLEGSALGSRLLYKRAQALGLDAGFGARHLAAQSERSDRWPRFLALLEQTDTLEMTRVTTASTTTFRAAEQAFERACHDAE